MATANTGRCCSCCCLFFIIIRLVCSLQRTRRFTSGHSGDKGRGGGSARRAARALSPAALSPPPTPRCLPALWATWGAPDVCCCCCCLIVSKSSWPYAPNPKHRGPTLNQSSGSFPPFPTPVTLNLDSPWPAEPSACVCARACGLAEGSRVCTCSVTFIDLFIDAEDRKCTSQAPPARRHLSH